MRIKGGGLVLAMGLAVGLTVTPLSAQRGPGFRGQAAGPFAGQSLDVLLEHQEELKLEANQLSQLNELKAVMDKDVKPLAEEMRTLRDQIRAGDVDRAEGGRQLQALRGRLMTAAAPLRGRIQEILTVEQHRELQRIVRQDRPGRGRGAARGGGRGGFARPGQGQGWQGMGSAFRGRPGRNPVGVRGQGWFGPGQGRPAAGFRRGGSGFPWFQDEAAPIPPAPPGGNGQGPEGAGIIG